MHNKSKFFCRVCGLYHGDPPWGDDGQCPTYEICSCCGVEFGYGDGDKENVIEIRKYWIENGYKWFIKKDKPKNWNLEKQLINIPKEFS